MAKKRTKAIGEFSGAYKFLSNFYLCDIEYEGITYPSVENAFQAAKTLDIVTRRTFVNIPPNKAKRKGRQVDLRPDWERVKIDIMHALLLIKFRDEDLASRLRETGDAKLIEGNWWNDKFWGVCTKSNQGENHLGKLLMEVRQTISS